MNEITPKYYTDTLTFALTRLWDGVNIDSLYLSIGDKSKYVCHAITEGAGHYFDMDGHDGMYLEAEDDLTESVNYMIRGIIAGGTAASACRCYDIVDNTAVQAIRKLLIEGMLAHYLTGTTEKPKNSLLQEIIENFKESKETS